LHRNGFEKLIRNDLCRWREIKKASKLWNRNAETQARERVSIWIEKKSKGTLERYRDLSKIRK
jgi:hypothetical protein